MTKSRITTYTARPQPAKNRTVCAAQRGKILQKTLPAKYGRSLHSVHAQSRAARGRRKKTDEGSTATPEPREGAPLSGSKRVGPRFPPTFQPNFRPSQAFFSVQLSAKLSAFSQAFNFPTSQALLSVLRSDKPSFPLSQAFSRIFSQAFSRVFGQAFSQAYQPSREPKLSFQPRFSDKPPA